MTLPGPPPGYGPDGPPDEPTPELPVRAFRSFAAVSAVMLLLLAAVAGLVYFLTEPDVKPTAKEKPREAPALNNANPCGHDTFDANTCAVRIIEVGAQQYQVSPAQVVAAYCQRWAKPAARRSQIQTWTSQGAYRREARAVLAQIMDYCPE